MNRANKRARRVNDDDGFGIAGLIESASEMYAGFDDEGIEVLRIKRPKLQFLGPQYLFQCRRNDQRVMANPCPKVIMIKL